MRIPRNFKSRCCDNEHVLHWDNLIKVWRCLHHRNVRCQTLRVTDATKRVIESYGLNERALKRKYAVSSVDALKYIRDHGKWSLADAAQRFNDIRYGRRAWTIQHGREVANPHFIEEQEAANVKQQRRVEWL